MKASNPITVFFSSLAILALFLTSCSNDDNNINSGTTTSWKINYNVTGINSSDIVSSSYFITYHGTYNNAVYREFSTNGEVKADNSYGISARVYLYNDTVNFSANKHTTLKYKYAARVERNDVVTRVIEQEYDVPPGKAGVIEYTTADERIIFRLQDFTVNWNLSN